MRKLINTLAVILILFSFLNTLNGQGWIRVGTEGHVQPTIDGNFISIDLSSQFAELTKTDYEANRIWRTAALESAFTSDSTQSTVRCIYEISNGRFLIAGSLNKTTTPSRSDIYIAEFTETAGIVWEKKMNFGSMVGYDAIATILPTDGGFLLCGHSDKALYPAETPIQKTLLIKIDETGELQWQTNFDEPGIPQSAVDVVALTNGTFMLRAINPLGLCGQNTTIFSISTAGEVLNETTYEDFRLVSTSRYEEALKIVPTPDNGLLFAIEIACNSGTLQITKTDEQGIVAWRDTIYHFRLGDMELSPEGNIVILGTYYSDEGNANDLLFREYTPDGEINWTRYIGGGADDSGLYVTPHPEGGYILVGKNGVIHPLTGLLYYVTPAYIWYKTDSLGRIYSNDINGNVFEDFDLDCEYNGEEGLLRWILGIESENHSTKYVVTDSSGYYDFPLDSGEYTVFIKNKTPYWNGCNDPFAAAVVADDTIIAHLPQQATVECPYLEVDISAPFLRRCFESTYSVIYCNRGTAPAENAYIEIELDAALTYISSSQALVSNVENLLTFNLGDVDMSACASFNITVLVGCDDVLLGQAHCTTAHIYPDEFCLETPDWSGASLDINAHCEGDSIQFVITNVGDVPTTEDLQYLIIEDQVILLIGDVPPISPSENITYKIATNGSTFRMEVEQEANHPGSDMPTVTVEGCASYSENISLGQVTQYWENDNDVFISIDCQENIGSFDPNDKRAYPKGYGEEHFINKNQDIEYRIRFQNTGTDTAFTVVVRDFISEKLDIATIRVGASSHPYDFEIVDGRVLKFTFSEINLVDSTSNEPQSHGFVKFKIQQIPNLSDGTTIENTAAIFFDFNYPVITDTAFHTIGTNFITSVFVPEAPPEAKKKEILAQPNPFTEGTLLDTELNRDYFPLDLQIFDVVGRKMSKELFVDSKIWFEPKDLPKGVYFFRIYSSGKELRHGKFIIQ